MTLAPLLAGPAIVVVHTLAATAALITGAAVLFLRKGTPLHKALGRLWAATMMLVAAISLGMTASIPAISAIFIFFRS